MTSCAEVIAAQEAIQRALVLVDEARRSGTRRLLGIAGAPGAGKSTLTEQLAAQLPEGSCVVVPMDGFHLADVALARLGRAQRKGAPDTFDAAGYAALLQRIRTAMPQDPSVWAPMFERELEQPLAGAIEVPAQVPLVITEGNYLLAEDGAFAQVPALLDARWFVETPDPLRHERLIARHERFGKTPQQARDWALGPDEANARLVAATRSRADAVVELG
ncbi:MULTISPECIES: nucleoside/nucleotide kinase family protein [Brachybacterium]|uniref:nucleoside/nucleotide kinase family protein n=1 Tax=Brachybacterium TaxID=43668 RepID=UPI000BB81C3A|nr:MULTISPECIES: nucleoside/nucleotide kinase family protein [Brachybacterium]PCC32309.1 nucleoside/nucleotide kinase family protein [Brachybacterium alimentarium]RCS62421.1 nucleoside/nucleotide kinase family protein [Brachybacterium alimentarium]RCS65651.1 nucleoside/nucleotide kinase family protein [Brachybacterium sp. JB7]RCS74438.1 nucleoside/nucleotide kinase family protein [Brachybacterium alimentarium]RCS79721.1 nucleoside/nucleotide kinase family protein [Brachybacterium alimentarium]